MDTHLSIESAAVEWRQEIATKLLWVITGLGALLCAGFLPAFIEAGAWSMLVTALAQNLSNLLMALKARWPLRLRAGWLIGNLVTTGLLAALPGYDRGVMASFLLGGIFTASVLLGVRGALVTLGLVILTLILIGWATVTGRMPSPTLDLDPVSSTGWLTLGVVLTLVASIGIVAAETAFLRSRRLQSVQLAAIADKDAGMAALVRAQAETEVALETLRKSEAERRSMSDVLDQTLAAIGIGFWEVDLRDGQSRWSDTMMRLVGHAPGSATADELWRKTTHPDDYARIMSGPPVDGSASEYRVILPDGTQRWHRSTMQVRTDEHGAPFMLRGLVSDITSDRLTKEQAARLAEVANRTSNGVVVTDLEARILWANAGFARLTGWNIDEIMGKKPGDFLQGPYTDKAEVARIRGAISRREPFECELLNYRKDGSQYWIHFEVRPSFDEAGAPNGFVAIETDITDRRLAASRDSLAQRIAARLLASPSIAEAGPEVVSELVSELDIVVAQLWLVEPDKPHLTYLTGASSPESGQAGQDFLARTRELEFGPGTEFIAGVGVPGMAWGTRRSTTLRELAPAGPRQFQSRRQQAAAQAGLQTFCATPILGPDGVLGVFEIGGTAFYPGHASIPALLERVAEQVASFLRHEQSRRAFEVVFHQSPDALLLVSEDGAIRRMNARAEDLLGAVADQRLDAFVDGVADLLHGPLPSGQLFNRDAQGRDAKFAAEISVARAVETGESAAIVAIRDLTERLRMEQALTQSLREKEMLLKEVHHRVKNNLQIVASLLTLQAEGLEQGPAHDALIETVYRVRSMSAVHQQLYGTMGLDRIELGEYAKQLCQSLQSSIAPDANLAFSIEGVEVSIENAIPCGLILNELITNSLKHGRSPDGRCHISLTIARAGSGFSLVLTDKGPGFPSAPTQSNSLGMQLIRSLARQLRGRISFDSEGGATVRLEVAHPL